MRSHLCVWVWFQQTGQVVQSGILHKQSHPDTCEKDGLHLGLINNYGANTDRTYWDMGRL